MKIYVDHPNTYHRMAVLAIFSLTIIIYSNSLNCGFVFDDIQNITQNPYMRLQELDAAKLFEAAFKSPMKNRPVANISFAVNYYLGKYNPTGYHLVNILIHLFNGILVYFLAVLTFNQNNAIQESNKYRSPNLSIYGMSLLAALLFIAHPLQVQSVTYIVQRMNSMATLFYLLALFFYIKGRTAALRWQQWTLWTGCLISWILALGSKETAATLPLALLLYEWFFWQDLDKNWLKKKYKYFIGLLALLGLVAYMFLGANPLDTILGSYAHRDFTMEERILTQFRVLVYYLGLLLYPHPTRINLLHSIETSHSLFDPVTTFFALLILTGLMVIAVCLAQKQRLISFCILWFFIHLVIESSIIGLEIIFEHRLYLPMFGFALLVAYLGFNLFSAKRIWALIVATALIVSLGSVTYLRNRIWQDPITLWYDVVSKNPQSSRAHYNLGSDLARQGRFTEAVNHFYEALKLKPDYSKAHNNLGLALFKQGKLTQAANHFSEALRIQPGNAAAHYNLGLVWEEQGNFKIAVDHYLKALQIKSDFAEAHNSLGIVLQAQGSYQQAFYHFAEALKLKPDLAEAHINMGSALEMQGNFKQAIDHYFTALRIRPDDAQTYNNLGVALTRQGILEEAARCYLKALQLKPEDAEAYNNLGVVLQRQGKPKEAAGHYSAALKLKPDYAEAYNNMGIVLTWQGRFQEAVESFSEALRIRPDDVQTRHNLALARRGIKPSAGEGKTILP